MNALQKPETYYSGCNQALLRAVPLSARWILEVGCAEGKLGAALRQANPFREVFGIEREPTIAAQAARRLNAVFTIDVETTDPPIAEASLDCILFGDVLEHLHDPEAVLRRLKRFLAPGGMVLASVPNVQHHSILTALLAGDFQYTDSGLLDTTHLRFFTYSTLIKLFLDAGFAPTLCEDIALLPPEELSKALDPLLGYLGLHRNRTHRYLNAYQYIISGKPLSEIDLALPQEPLSFVACVSDEARLRANLLASPCLRPGSPHEVILMRAQRTAADGLNGGIARARHPIVVCVHQDVYLPSSWPQRFLAQYRQAEQSLGAFGVAGVYGVVRKGKAILRAGHIVDRDRLLWEPASLPAKVDTLDEVVLALSRGTALRFDPLLSFHFYGADICLQARAETLPAVALDALCFHNSLSVGLNRDFLSSGEVFKKKWPEKLPLVTSCVVIDTDGRMRLS